MVARETVIAEALDRLNLTGSSGPAKAAAILGRFADMLRSEGVRRGFLGPDEAERILERHILDSAALASFLPEGPLVDVGSGAGLPGIVLAALGKGPVTLVDSNSRRAAFARAAAADLGLPVVVRQARAEDLGRDPDVRDAFVVGVARALAPPPVALELVMPLVGSGGLIALAIGPSGLDDVRSDGAARALGGGMPTTHPIAVPGSDLHRYVMIVEKLGATPERYPRRAGTPARRPLGGPAPGADDGGR
jgi:16S rRNA (guanine527-N7)-methyltransferase